VHQLSWVRVGCACACSPRVPVFYAWRCGRRLRFQAGAAAVVPAFPAALYVLLISYLALVLVPFIDLLDVLACLHIVKLTSAYLLLTLVIKLTWKLLNILTVAYSVSTHKLDTPLLLAPTKLKLLCHDACSFVRVSQRLGSAVSRHSFCSQRNGPPLLNCHVPLSPRPSLSVEGSRTGRLVGTYTCVHRDALREQQDGASSPHRYSEVAYELTWRQPLNLYRRGRCPSLLSLYVSYTSQILHTVHQI
jgi:hypothetical protein